MKKLLNCLYITSQGSYLHKERETIVVKNDGKKLGQFPSININSIFCFGQVTVSPFLMGHCAEKGIGLGFYTEHGRFLARMQGRGSGNVLLRRAQYRWADDPEKTAAIAGLIVAAKIANSRSILQRELRNHGEDVLLANTIKRLGTSVRRAKQAEHVDSVRGMEGEAAAAYFSVFGRLVRNGDFVFGGRVRRPPTDAVNALLSFTYSLVTQECLSALAGVGLDPYVGFLHRDRPGRPGLALDLVEEFRSPWSERFVLTLLNRRQFQTKDFVTEASGAVRLTDDARKMFLAAWQERKLVEVVHPYLEEKVPIGLLPHCQALLLARHIRGDMQYYPPFLNK